MSEGGRNIPAGNFLLVNGAKPCQLNISLFPLLHLSFGLTIRYVYGASPAGRNLHSGFIGEPTGIADLIPKSGSLHRTLASGISRALINEEKCIWLSLRKNCGKKSPFRVASWRWKVWLTIF
jgi:hypothetical protein